MDDLSNKTGLALETIERLWRITMGVDDGNFDDGIETVDAVSLHSRKQILFVTTGGNGHCLNLYVFGNSGNDSRALWELSGLPNDAGICHEPTLPYPTAYARPTGDIVVQVPTAAAWVKRKEPLGAYPVSTALMFYTYRWTGVTYKLATTRKIVTYGSTTFNPEKCTEDKPCP
jgi:hypothetical protein